MSSLIRYLDEIEEKSGRFRVLIAEDGGGIIGFIIGSIEDDPELAAGRCGVLEDWFVEEECRGGGTGKMLFESLMPWFEENGCGRLSSATWITNDLSRAVHEKIGFLEYTVTFGKKL